MIIVTGAAGFIGSHVADFYSKNHRLLLVDAPGHFRERKYVNSGDSTLWDWATGQEEREARHKILDRAYFPKILEVIGPSAPEKNTKAKEHVLFPPGEKIECVIHLGACTDTAEFRTDFLEKWNVDYTKSIWMWCTRHAVPLIFASSGATYGGGEAGFRDDWETTNKLKPLNPYGQSKQDFDLWAQQEMKGGRTPPHWYGLKFFNVYGSRESHKGPMASAVLHGFREIMRTGRCRLFKSHNPQVKDGEQSRDFIHVSDIVKLVEHFRVSKPASGLYNCGTGKARTFHSLMEALFKSVQKPMKVEWIDTPEQYRKAYQYFTEAEMSRTLGTGYDSPFLSLEEGVAEYAAWLQKNEPTEAGYH